MADLLAAVTDSFEDALQAEFERDPDLSVLDADVAERVGKMAAQMAVSNLRWQRALGKSMITTELAQAWGVSRQALFDRLRNSSLIGLPGRSTTYFPMWQFDDDSWRTHRVRPVVMKILEAFRGADGKVDQEAVVAWAASPQPELRGCAPRDVINDPGSEMDLVRAAAAAAREFGQ
jgi:hypothetical protein